VPKDETKKVARDLVKSFNDKGETHLPSHLITQETVTRFTEAIRIPRNGGGRQLTDSEVVLPRDAFPDQQFEEQILIANDELAFIAWDLTATHEGEFFGHPATGQKVTVHGADIVRVHGGKLVEHWNFYSKPRVHALARLGLLDVPTSQELKRRRLLGPGRARGVVVDE
jgi:predicted ester cyclase